MSAQIIIESPNQQPLAVPPKAYPYAQYSDDPNVGAFFSAYNQIALGYLQWFNQNGLGLYIGKSGALLDWIGTNLYGLPRPIVGSVTKSQRAAAGTIPIAQQAINYNRIKESGYAQPVSDDIYQRYLTMWLYLGDGKQMSIDWIRRRIARFLYGEGGTDIEIGEIQNVSVLRPYYSRGAVGTQPINVQAVNSYNSQAVSSKHSLHIKISSSVQAYALQSLFNAGLLPLPFQITFNLLIG